MIKEIKRYIYYLSFSVRWRLRLRRFHSLWLRRRSERFYISICLSSISFSNIAVYLTVTIGILTMAAPY